MNRHRSGTAAWLQEEKHCGSAGPSHGIREESATLTQHEFGRAVEVTTHNGQLAEAAAKFDRLPFLAAWRAIAADGASLHAVLRISDIEPMLAFADAAHKSGWSLLLAEFDEDRRDVPE